MQCNSYVISTQDLDTRNKVDYTHIGFSMLIILLFISTIFLPFINSIKGKGKGKAVPVF
jgi:hypothetical protein